jgi:para-nitrobenzyl esterase
MYLDNDYYLSNFYEERESWGFYKDIEEINLLIDDIKDDRQKINYLLTARNWTCPSSYIAKSINDHTNKNVWFYSFDRVRDGLKSKEMGAYHGAELPYVFNTHDEWLPTSNKDLYITKIMQSYWINFLRDGNPDPNNNSWKSFEANKFNVLSFNDKISMQTSNSVDVCEALGY